MINCLWLFYFYMHLYIGITAVQRKYLRHDLN